MVGSSVFGNCPESASDLAEWSRLMPGLMRRTGHKSSHYLEDGIMAKVRQVKPIIFSFLKEKDEHNMFVADNGIILLVPKATDESLIFRDENMAKLQNHPFPTRIRKIREAKGMTQKDLAAAAELSQGEVSAIESGSSQPSRRILKRLQQALSVDFNFFD